MAFQTWTGWLQAYTYVTCPILTLSCTTLFNISVVSLQHLIRPLCSKLHTCIVILSSAVFSQCFLYTLFYCRSRALVKVAIFPIYDVIIYSLWFPLANLFLPLLSFSFCLLDYVSCSPRLPWYIIQLGVSILCVDHMY